MGGFRHEVLGRVDIQEELIVSYASDRADACHWPVGPICVFPIDYHWLPPSTPGAPSFTSARAVRRRRVRRGTVTEGTLVDSLHAGTHVPATTFMYI